jgi:hypothetical protein
MLLEKPLLITACNDRARVMPAQQERSLLAVATAAGIGFTGG